MSDDSYFENEEDEGSQESSVIKELRKKVKDLEGKAVQAGKVEELERKLLLHDAGLGKLKPKQVTALLNSHDGEWDSESIQATASELGFVPANSDSETTEDETKLQISDEERKAHEINEQAAGKFVRHMDPEEELVAKIRETTNEDELIALLEANPRPDGSSRLRTY